MYSLKLGCVFAAAARREAVVVDAGRLRMSAWSEGILPSPQAGRHACFATLSQALAWPPDAALLTCTG